VTDAEYSGAAGLPPTQPPAAEAPNDLGAAEARLAEIEAKLAAAVAEAQQLREDWLRAKAETENVRRRSQEEVARAHRFGLESFAAALLAVKDSLDAALTVENTSIESFKEGVELTARQLDSVFEKFSIREIEALGERFDPHRHQAISQLQSGEEPNTVVSVLQKGYFLHDRVLRPALVVVAAAQNPAEA